MAVQTKVNPTMDATRGRTFTGATLNCFTIDLAVNATNFASTEMGPNGAVQEVLQVITGQFTVVGMSALRSDGANAGQVFDVLIEQEYGTDTYDGTNSETLAAHLEDLIQARTAAGVGPVDLSSATVAVKEGFPMFANHV